MNEIFDRAMKLQKELPREIMAHKLSAEHHRHWNMALGGLSTVLTTIVGTTIFTGLVSQLGLDGKGEIRNPFLEQGMDWLYVIVILLSISAPVLSALYTFLHHGEDYSRHMAGVEGYANVLSRITIFLAQYGEPNATTEKRDQALNEYNLIMQEYNSMPAKTLTLTKKAYKDADRVILERGESTQ